MTQNKEAFEALIRMQCIIENNTDGGDYEDYETTRKALEQAQENEAAIRALKNTVERVPQMITASINDNYGRRPFVCGADAKEISDMCREALKHHAPAIKRSERK